jgi:menaquinone-dependent protoporphyrinogen oxidase
MPCLIVYATKYGTVQKVANILKEKIKDEVVMINIIKEKVPSLDDYDTVIIGGSIYVGKVQKDLKKFIKGNLPKLLQKRLGLFICAGEAEPVCSKELKEAFPTELYNHALVKEVLGHEFNFVKLNFLDKIILKKIKGITQSYSKLATEKIEEFAKAIRPE